MRLILQACSRLASVPQRSSCVRVNCTQLLSNHDITWQQTRSMRLYKERTRRIMYWRGRSFDRVPFDNKHRSERQEWNYRSEIYAFSRRLQENLSEDTLRRIFCTPQYLSKIKDAQQKLNLPEPNIESNADLVDRGETLLDLCLKPYLRFMFQQLPEDGVDKITEYMKSDEALADMAKWFGCKDLILSCENPPSQRSMADTVKALLAGIEQDLGLERVRRFAVDMMIPYINDKDILDDIWILPNPKDTLNMILKNNQLPQYEARIMYQTGYKTIESCYVVGLYVNKQFIGSNPGETLEIAEECAALDALQRLFDLGVDRAPFVYGEASEKINFDAFMKPHCTISDVQFKFPEQ